jgi:hypothetical protein
MTGGDVLEPSNIALSLPSANDVSAALFTLVVRLVRKITQLLQTLQNGPLDNTAAATCS